MLLSTDGVGLCHNAWRGYEFDDVEGGVSSSIVSTRNDLILVTITSTRTYGGLHVVH